MLRAITKLLSLSAVLTVGIVMILLYRNHTAQERHEAELEDQNQQLLRVVDRLTDEARVAEMLVTDQKTVDGVPLTTLLFVEYARNHTALPPRIFTIRGNEVHLDAMVIKFDRGFVEKDDALRGRSIALFTRIYGNRQSPDEGSTIDTPGQVPGYYQDADQGVTRFETELWTHFWQLAGDESYRKEKGVRICNGEGPWWPCEADKLYTISIESAGGLNVTYEPVKPIYREALKRKNAGL
jgi:hypothetical protein